MRVGSSRSNLSAQLGQETIYLIMTIAIAVALILAMLVTRHTSPEKEPPIITMREAEGFNFAPGSTNVSAQFVKNLRDKVVPQIVEARWKYKASILEVVGHTDEVPIKTARRQITNLDYTLGPMLAGQPAKLPIAADNVGLGMARAVAVARMLKAEGLKNDYQIIPMSAGPFQKTDDSAAALGKGVAEAARRRIEIRIRRARQP